MKSKQPSSCGFTRNNSTCTRGMILPTDRVEKEEYRWRIIDGEPKWYYQPKVGTEEKTKHKYQPRAISCTRPEFPLYGHSLDKYTRFLSWCPSIQHTNIPVHHQVPGTTKYRHTMKMCSSKASAIYDGYTSTCTRTRYAIYQNRMIHWRTPSKSQADDAHVTRCEMVREGRRHLPIFSPDRLRDLVRGWHKIQKASTSDDHTVFFRVAVHSTTPYY